MRQHQRNASVLAPADSWRRAPRLKACPHPRRLIRLSERRAAATIVNAAADCCPSWDSCTLQSSTTHHQCCRPHYSSARRSVHPGTPACTDRSLLWLSDRVCSRRVGASNELARRALSAKLIVDHVCIRIEVGSGRISAADNDSRAWTRDRGRWIEVQCKGVGAASEETRGVIEVGD